MFEHQLILLNCEKKSEGRGWGGKITILPFLFTCSTVIKMTTSRNPDSPVLEYDKKFGLFVHFLTFLFFFYF